MKKLFKKPTLLLILGSILILGDIPFGIYTISLNNTEGWGAVFTILILVVGILSIIIDRLLIRVINNIKLSIYELIFLILISAYFSYNSRTLTIEELNPKTDFIILVENKGKFKNTKSNYIFPFSWKITTTESLVIAQDLPIKIEIISPENWNNSYYYNSYDFSNNLRVYLYAKNENVINRVKVFNYIKRNLK